MIATGIIGFPIAKILDYLLGEHHITRYRNQDLKTLIELHSKQAIEKIAEEISIEEGDFGLNLFQAQIAKSAIDMNKKIKEMMVPSKNIYSIKLKKKMSYKQAKRIAKAGYSRIPVCKGDLDTVVGILLIKSLIGLDLHNEESLEHLIKDDIVTLRKPIFCGPDEEMWSLLTKFKNGRSHMAIVSDDPEGMKKKLSQHYVDDSLVLSADDDLSQDH